MRNVYVLGVGMIKFGRYPAKDISQLGGEAAVQALKDAGLSIKDVEMFVCGNLFQANAMNGQKILQQIGTNRHPRLQCLKCLCHWLNCCSRSVRWCCLRYVRRHYGCRR